MNKFHCKKSWSGKHSFENKRAWIVKGTFPKCYACGLVLDTISISKFIKSKKDFEKRKVKRMKALLNRK